MDNLIVLALSVLTLRVGFLLTVAGSSRAKNAASAVARVLADLAIASLCAFVIGGIVLAAGRVEEPGAVFAHLVRVNFPRSVATFTLLATVASGIVVGPIVERARFGVTLIAAALLGGVVLPVFYRWQGGWLGDLKTGGLGFIDFAGASLHVIGGAAALVAAFLVGSRNGKYHRDGSASVIPGHAVPLLGAGTCVTLLGLVGIAAFGGDALGALNTLLGAAAGAAASLIVSHLRFGKPDVLLLTSGLLGGAISVAAGDGTLLPIWAIVLGGVGGVLAALASVTLDLRLHVDDPTGAISAHLVGGAWGLIAAGVVTPGATWTTVAVQMLGAATAAILAGVVMLVTLKLLGKQARVREADEFDGLDLAEHDIGAYPDFQQNTIRSYHLREA